MNYSLNALVDKAMAGGGSLDARIAAFEAALIPQLAEVANAIRDGEPIPVRAACGGDWR